MRYRKLTEDKDYAFGQRAGEFYIDSPEAVGQAVGTRLALLQGEWFLDDTAGTPYSTQVLGKGTTPLYDLAIRTRIIQTQGVEEIVSYQSSLDRDLRKLTVNAEINTIYGPITIQQVL